MNKSPKIKHLSWGKMEVEGYPPGKDFIVYPGGADPWDWNLSNTSHEDGIQPEDVKLLLSKGAEIIVLSRGFSERLGVSQETIEILEEAKIEYVVLKTDEAVEKYNHLAETRQVGGLFHSTC